ncbi:MAG: Stp1/IreP family PP2C-type Ser/Thr phosphatase [Candidatus Poribacteria bacterium]|nr:Stp1/IreP family PP2C-type Ser/Thr phosphatase [Candidatus Poribacteria bacterium]
MKFAARTDIGKYRTLNEDLYFIDEDIGLFVLADGVGGHDAGDVASSIAVAVFQEWADEIRKLPAESTDTSSSEKLETLKALVDEANHRVYERSLTRDFSNGMGTTLIGGIITPSELIYAHVGDSRLYVLRDGVLEQVTKDHSLVQKLVDIGQLTPREARVHRHRNIIDRAIGFESSVEVDYEIYPLTSDDIVLACTDGLHDMIVDDAEIARIITDASDLDAASRGLIDKVLEYGGKDNVTLVLAAPC